MEYQTTNSNPSHAQNWWTVNGHRFFCGNIRLATALVGWSLTFASALISTALAGPANYTFTKIATLGVAPNFGDFEVGRINNRGQVIFVSETAQCVDTGLGFSLCEGVFLWNHGQLTQLVMPGAPAPGGGTFAGAADGPAAINDAGEAALVVWQTPFIFPLGFDGGVYRYSTASGSLSALVY